MNAPANILARVGQITAGFARLEVLLRGGPAVQDYASACFVQFFMEECAMKNLNHSSIMAGLLGAGALLMAAIPASAGEWDNPDMEGTILNDLDRPAYVGTGLSETSPRVYIYGSSGAFSDLDMDHTGFAIGAAGPEKGDGDLYGSALFDVGALQ
jgi:hypothetical protein